MLIERMRCEACSTAVEGHFELEWPAQLSREQLGFVKVFLSCRGKIKDVEQALGISYPTVVSRLDEVVARLAPAAEPKRARRLKILEQLAAGTIGLDEAEKLLRDQPKEKK
jgi:hypothetical protein